MTTSVAEDLGNDEGDEICLIKPSFGDPTEVWISRFGIRTTNKRRVFVHFYCALTSPRCWFTGAEWKNVYREVNRGRSMVCNECGHRGATIGCAVDRCSMVLHLPCAIKQGYQQLRYNLNFYCQDHRKTIKEDAAKAQRQAIQQQGRGTFKQDVSRGTENIPIGYQNVYDKATPLHPNPSSTSSTSNDQSASSFQYVVTNVDSDEVITNNLTVAGTDYCTCVDMCDDVNGGCSCIERGRNYTSQGTLIPDITQRIVECNFKCACSYRRCTNRVVQRGLNSRLEIFRSRDELKAVSDWTQVRDADVSSALPSSPGKISQSSTAAAVAANSGIGVHGWGVRTLDFIPQYSFVCELMGQWFHLSDQDRTAAGEDWAIQARRIRVLGWQEEQDRYEEQERQRMVASFLSSAPAKPKKMKRRRKSDYLAPSTKKKKPVPAAPMTVSINSTVLQMNDDSTETEDGGRMQMAGRTGGDALGAVVEEDDDEQEHNELDDDCYFREEESPVKARTSAIVPIAAGRAKYLEQSLVNDLCVSIVDAFAHLYRC